MTKHVIIGRGNLGCALKNALGDSARFHTDRVSSVGPDYGAMPEEYIWCTIGGGSVAQGKADPVGMMEAHLQIPLGMAARKRPDQKLIVFSSDYAEEPSKSLYASSKHFMELAMERFPNVFCYRVSSLYGQYFPEKTFVGRMITCFLSQVWIELSKNEVIPTPVDWLAQRAVASVESGLKAAYLVPNQPIAAHQWAELVFMTARIVHPGVYDQFIPLIKKELVVDEERPVVIRGKPRFPFADHPDNSVEHLWSIHGPETVRSFFHHRGIKV